MPFIPAPGVIQAVLNQELFGQNVVNVLNFRIGIGGAVTAEQLEFVAQYLGTWWVNELAISLSNNLLLRSVVTRSMDVQDGQQFVLAPGTPPAGLIDGPSLPGSVAFCVTHRTAFLGRSRRGRTYVAGLVEADVFGNNLNGVRATNISNSFNTLRTDLDASGFDFVIVSRQANKVARTIAEATAVIQTVAIDTRVDSQRGRVR